MCGLVGMFGKSIVAGDHRILIEMLRTLYLRGPHSTGLGWWDQKRPGLDWIKHNVTPDNFLADKDVIAKLEKIKDPITVMGHVRFATRGKTSPDNAHPFRAKHILMAHNGSLNSIFGMKNFHHFEVDSEALAQHIADVGIDQAVKDANGAWAITYIDATQRTFNIVRNSQRDLYITRERGRDTWYYSSEKKHLDWILSRNNYNYEEITQVPIHTLLTYDYKKNKLTQRPVEIYNTLHYPAGNIYGYDEDGQWEPQWKKNQQAHIGFLANHFKGPLGTAEEWMKLYGLAERKWIKVNINTYHPYQNGHQNSGWIKGEFEAAQSPECNIRGWNFSPEKVGTKAFIPGWYACQISSVRWDSRDKEYVINVDEYQNIKDCPEAVEPLLMKEDSAVKVTQTNLSFKEPDGLNKGMFERLTKNGCSCCKRNLYWNKSEDVYWFKVEGDDKPMCGVCVNALEDLGCDEAKAIEFIKQSEKEPIFQAANTKH